MSGFIKLYRQIADNPIWRIKPFSEGQAWIDILCITNYEKGFIKTKNGEIITIQCGECGYSVLTLSERWGWSRGKVKRFLSLLEKQEMIQQKMHGKHTIINVLNFSKYQSRTTNDTTNDTTNGQQTDTIKKNKEEKEKEKINKKEKEILENFESFYSFYPIKKSRTKAFEAYKKAVLADEKVRAKLQPSIIGGKNTALETSHQAIMDGLKKYIAEIEAKNTEAKYIKHPTTWLNQKCWEDEYLTPQQREQPSLPLTNEKGEINLHVYNPRL